MWICSALAFAGAATLIGPALAQTASSGQSSGIAYSIQLQATIDPATQKWISSALDDAASENAKIAIIRLDTPGGLSDSMRSIIEDMGSAPMPVVVYVSPSNARAGSAGAYITEAADVAAMYPISNIGSATPIAIGPGGGSSDLDRKIKNDAAASMRALAAAHGRNPKLAQLLVTEAKNLTAKEAKRAGLIDLISPSQEALLRQLDGFHVKGPKAQTLHTAGLQIENHDMPLQYQLLEILVNPNVAYLLILIGLVGMVIELFSPGLIVPGTIGVISFLLGLYGTAQLPVTAAGVLLLVFGVAMIIAEAHLPTHGILGASGVAALIASGLVLYDTNTSSFEISPVVVILAGPSDGRLPRLRGRAERSALGACRRARAGRRWSAPWARCATRSTRSARSSSKEPCGRRSWRPRTTGHRMPPPNRPQMVGPYRRGSRVRVESVEGLTLRVRPLEGEPDAAEDPATAT